MLEGNTMRRIHVWMLGLALLSSGCAYSQQNPQQMSLTIPGNTRMIILVNSEAEVSVVDVNGRTIPTCQLCTEDLEKRYGLQCKNTPAEIRICQSLTGATLSKVNSIEIFRSRYNRTCITEIVAGQATEICWD
jgi:hypothetical protein